MAVFEAELVGDGTQDLVLPDRSPGNENVKRRLVRGPHRLGSGFDLLGRQEPALGQQL